MLPFTILTVLGVSLSRLAWTDIRRLEVDLPAATIATGSLIALRLVSDAPVLFPVAIAILIAGLVAATALLRPRRIGLGDAAIIPLIPLAAPPGEIAPLLVLYALFILVIALLYNRLRRKPLRRMFRHATPAAPAASLAALVGAALLAGATPIEAAGIAVCTCAVVIAFVMRPRPQSIRSVRPHDA